jgi:acyl carrier protein
MTSLEKVSGFADQLRQYVLEALGEVIDEADLRSYSLQQLDSLGVTEVLSALEDTIDREIDFQAFAPETSLAELVEFARQATR